MSRFRAAGFLIASGMLSGGLSAFPTSPVAGVVKHLQAPVPGALVLVYGVADTTFNRVKTRPDGSFLVESIPAGVYDVIAYKTGYYPSLVRLWHQAAPSASGLAIELVPETSSRIARVDPDVWTWRESLPSDVLREITTETSDLPSATPLISLSKFLSGEFSAQSSAGGGAASMARTDINLAGQLPGSIQYGLRGSYSSFNASQNASLSQGRATDAVLLLSNSPDSAVAIGIGSRRLTLLDASGGGTPEYDHESATWTHSGDSGDSAEASASRVTQTGFDQATSIRPDLAAASSQSYEVRGRYVRDSGDDRYSIAVQAASRRFESPDTAGGATANFEDGTVELAGERALLESLLLGARLEARYWNSTTSLAPGATLRLRLGPDTSFLLSASRRVNESARNSENVAPPVTSPEALEGASRSQVSAALSMRGDFDSRLELSAVSRNVAEPMRIYFDGDMLLDAGSLYIFDGNRLQKVSATASARLFEFLDAALSGEAGRIDGRVSEETRTQFDVVNNSARYFGGQAAVTVRPTHTDVRCAVRRSRQVLQTESDSTENFSDTLRLSLGQDLTVLGFDPFGAAWHLVVAYETDRNPLIEDTNSEDSGSLKKRFLGGISISF